MAPFDSRGQLHLMGKKGSVVIYLQPYILVPLLAYCFPVKVCMFTA